MTKLDIERLSKALVTDFQALVNANPGEHFCAFALYSDDDAWTIVPAANSDEGTRRRQKSYADSGMKISEAEIRVSTAEWPYESFEAPNILAAVHPLIQAEKEWASDAERESAVGETWAAMFLTLKSAADELRTTANNAGLHLLCSISDSDEAIWLEFESSRLLNQQSSHQGFFSVWPAGAHKALKKQLSHASPMQQAFWQALDQD
jgi:hypothetical protein